MAKDDYFVIVYKILAYLYTCLKKDLPIDENMISYDGKLFSISENYHIYIIDHMQRQGLIEGVKVARDHDDIAVYCDLENCRISPDGIAYLMDNRFMKKAKDFAKSVKEITPFI